MKLSDIKINCRHFRGDIPCKPNKLYGVHCVDEKGNDCSYFDPAEQKILIIKLGAIGDVIRSTPLLEPIKKNYPHAKIYWLTYSPSVVPDLVDVVLKFNAEGITFLENVEFDIIYNLDKDKEACALINKLKSKIKKGFILKDGIPFPADNAAVHKYLTGLFDDISQQNKKNYIEEIFEICGFKFNREKYILSSFPQYGEEWDLDRSKKIIGLNTGCGGRWTSRLWDDKNWIELAKTLLNKGDYDVVFLGGEQEDEKNKYFSKKTGGKYFGHFKLEKFINLVDQCELVVTSVTMAMHITIGLGKKIVLFNNIFNPNEFELYGQGEIVQPSKECKCFYMPVCVNDEYRCMEYIDVNRVFGIIEKLFSS